MKYEDCVIRSIFCNNDYGIKVVNELINMADLVFDVDRYADVKSLIEIGDFASIRLLNNKLKSGPNVSLAQYLGILRFSDQDQKV